jgi:hypothetical protein
MNSALAIQFSSVDLISFMGGSEEHGIGWEKVLSYKSVEIGVE